MAFLESLGLSDQLDSFSGRKRIQKIVYLLKQFGADLRFGYTWYIHGPYSPELTRTLLSPSDSDLKHVRKLTTAELGKINSLRNFLGEDYYSVDSLELIGSLVYLIKHGSREGYNTKTKIVKFLKQQKPQFSNNEIERAWTKITDSTVWESFLKELS